MPSLIPNNKKWLSLGILDLLYSFCLVSLAFISKLVMDGAQNKDIDRVISFSLIFLAVILLGLAFKLIKNILYVKISLKREEELKRLLFKERLQSKLSFDNVHTGVLIQSFTSDIRNIVSGEVDTYPNIFFEVGRLGFAVISVFFIDWRILLVLLLLGLVGLLVARIYSRYLKRLHRDTLDNEGKLNSFFQESMENIKLIQSYEAKDNFNSYYLANENLYFNSKRKMYHFQLIAGNILTLGSNIIYAAYIFYGGYSIAKGLMSYGTLIAILQLMSHIQSPIMSFSNIINRYSLYKTSYGRLNERLRGEVRKTPALDSFDYIELSNISFGYNEDALFKDLSFTIKNGEVIQIKGHSGIGKTSLFMILLGFISPKKGEMKAYYNSKEYDYSEAKRLFSYVAQENILFSGTIRDNFNLLVGKDCDILRALRFSNIYEEIMELPNGLDTRLNERGSGLSIGQLQRIMIAIAYAKDRPIFLLDEFTSALDEKNSRAIIENLKRENKTIIFISHKNEAIEPDKIIDLEKYL